MEHTYRALAAIDRELRALRTPSELMLSPAEAAARRAVLEADKADHWERLGILREEPAVAETSRRRRAAP